MGRARYVPCIWEALSIYVPTRPSVRSKVGTLYIRWLGVLDITISAFGICD